MQQQQAQQQRGSGLTSVTLNERGSGLTSVTLTDEELLVVQQQQSQQQQQQLSQQTSVPSYVDYTSFDSVSLGQVVATYFVL